jgi:hypothetical protein
MRRNVSLSSPIPKFGKEAVILTTTVATEEAPSGMLVRGKYNAVSSFIDDDNIVHLKFDWTLEIKKEW